MPPPAGQRRCGWFDAVVARYAARINGLTHLAVTKLDVLDPISTLPVCVGYRVDGEQLDEIPADAERFDRVEPVYETMEGWCRSTGSARRLADLPREARVYLERIESLVAAPISYVSVGSARDQLISVD